MELNLITSIRTNNFYDKEVMIKIKAMWEEASHELTQHHDTTYGVYYDYESDYKGDYSLGVAIESDKASEDPPVIEIPNTEIYRIYDADTNDEQGIFKTWSKIWDLEEEGILNRAYTFDFEKYYPNGKTEIHIAIK
ncbi:GyrI-like domain-containing protein [Virgibacillus alimentarius]|uniref:GyrI-like domain-containing protein n=1 Tax=Virgibacillus alimentarius TaxID=698769 RepID=UPI00049323F2|nr:GyrI-like domain-containing protein [Virgibacillus alimentarius]